MFKRAQVTNPLLDSEIERALKFLNGEKLSSEEYDQALETLIKLEKIKDQQKSSQISKDAMLTAGVNILGILLIIRHEHLNVITSRAMNMVIKPKN